MRVIAGTLKGRTLRAPTGSETRPTADRVREALFSILGSMDGLNVLDLYAGTGALGIEALSRGAGQAVFVEAASSAMRCFRQNLSKLNLDDRSRVLHAWVERSDHEIANWAPYDLAFCDPPWSRSDEAWKFLADINVARLISTYGRLVLEHPANRAYDGDSLGQMQVIRRRTWGDSAVTILQRNVAAAQT